LALCDPNFESVPSNDWPEMEPIRGAEAAWDFYVETDQPWETTPYEYVDLIDDGSDNAVGQMRREMRGKASGAAVTYSYWVAVTFRNGRVLRIEWFAARGDALEAAGLSEEAMSRENVETARRFTEALVRGDYAAAATELGPKVEIDDTDIPESTGTDSFYAWLARWDEAWESWRIEDLEVRAVGGDRTISLFKMIARGKGSGIELARDDAVVTEYRDGKIVRLAYYNDQSQAFEAVGLSG